MVLVRTSRGRRDARSSLRLFRVGEGVAARGACCRWPSPCSASPLAGRTSPLTASGIWACRTGSPAPGCRASSRTAAASCGSAPSEGLNRYAGGVVKAYRHDPADPRSLPIASVNAIFEDSRRRLWLGGGVAHRHRWPRALRLRPGSLRVLPHRRRSEASRAPSGARHRRGSPAAHLDRRRGRSLLLRRDQGQLHPVPASGRSGDEPQRRRGPVAARGPSGPALGRHGLGSRLPRHALGPHRSLAHSVDGSSRPSASCRRVWALHEGGDGTLWVGTRGDGLHHLDPATGRDTRYVFRAGTNSIGSDYVLALAGDGRNRIFIGLENAGLDILDTASGRFTHHTPRLDDPSQPERDVDPEPAVRRPGHPLDRHLLWRRRTCCRLSPRGST